MTDNDGGLGGGPVTARLIRFRYPATCSVCATPLPPGTRAWWDSSTGTAACAGCQQSHGGDLPTENPPDPARQSPPSSPSTQQFVGEAGGSAREEYKRRHQKREARIDQRWGRLAGVVKFLSDDPQSTQAWAKGSEGERRLAAHLLREVGDRAVLINDRKVPGTRGNIDHLVVAATGVWVIDAKNYGGRVEQRDVGGWFKTDKRLYVGGRDRTKIAQGLGWQVDAVQRALNRTDVPLHSALCFIEADWKLLAKPFQQNGAWVTWAKKLVEMIAQSGPLTPDDVTQISNRLASALPPAVR